MEGKITAKFWTEERILVLAGSHRIDGFHTSIKSDDEVVQVETESQSVCYRQLLVEAVETEGPLLLSFVLADVPDVAGIDESGTSCRAVKDRKTSAQPGGITQQDQQGTVQVRTGERENAFK